MKKKWLIALTMLVVCGVAVWVGAGALRQPKESRGIFIWGAPITQPQEQQTMLSALKRLSINAVYQEFPGDELSDAAEYISVLKSAYIDTYLLTGQPQWGLEADGASLIKEIDRAVSMGGQLAGIMVDVEPYLTKEWDKDENAVMQSYVQGMSTAYQYAEQKGLALIACIPYWYDNSHTAALEQLIATGCDAVAVMNYYRKNEAEHMQTELELARKANKEAICIFEFQPPGKHSLTEKETYYTLGLDAAHQSWESIKKQLGSKQLGFAYHWYSSILELL
ncbi:MAG: hypothetical protein VB100_09505 [Angelakisella sp.]|nr:hypothetical protein [Angelakisella sp.]